MSNGDSQPQSVTVIGPDQKKYQFPPGTTKEKAIAYFRQKKIGAPKAAATPPTSSPDARPKQNAGLTSTNPNYLTSPGGLGRKIEVGAGLGSEHAFGLKEPVKGDPASLKWGDAASQIVGNLGGAATQSLKAWGPLAPIDMIAKAIEATASGIESGGKETLHGVEQGNARKITEGLFQAGGSAGLMMEGEKKAGETVDKAAKLPDPKVLMSRSKMAELENQYIHARGLEVGGMVKDAVGKIVGRDGEIERHAKALDRAVPKDAIDGADVLTKAKQAVADIVKTPAKYPQEIQQMAKAITEHPPGKWDFETAKQFRTLVNGVMSRTSGPMKAAMTEVYKDLTDKMASAAKSVPGGEFSWTHYNELTKKFHQQYKDFVDDVTQSQSGKDVARRLLQDQAVTKEVLRSVSKYGAKVEPIEKFMKQADAAIKNQKSLSGSLFRVIYGTGAGAATYFGARMLGVPWVASIAPAILAGLSSVYLKNLKSVVDLDPKLFEKVMGERELPGPKAPTAKPAPGQPPATPGAPTTTPSPQTPPATSKLTPLTDVEKQALRAKRPTTSSPTSGAPPTTPEANASTTASSSSGEPSVTKVPEGVHGKGKLGVRAKDAERKAASRAQSKAEAPQEVLDKVFKYSSVDEVPTVEIEQDLQSMGKDGKLLYNALQKVRKAEKWDDDIYRGELMDTFISYIRRANEKKASSGTETP